MAKAGDVGSETECEVCHTGLLAIVATAVAALSSIIVAAPKVCAGAGK